MEDFSRYFHCSPERLGPRHIREYQAALFHTRKFAPSTVTQHLAALRFFYVKTLKKAWSITETPYPKKAVRLPTILSQEEVARLIDAAHPPLHRTLLMALYATGLRRAELAQLKVRDVDSQRMVIHVQGVRAAKTATCCSAQSCSTNSSGTGAGCSENPANGSFRVIGTILAISPLQRK